MDYKKAAQQVLDNIGGASNIVSAAHCATRLRLVIADNSKVNKKELENAEGAKGVFEAQGQLQIIFGTGIVNKVYDEFTALAGITGASKEEVKQAAASKAPWYQRAIKTLGDIFVPIIPAIVASGFLMGIMEALNFMVNNGFLNIDTSGSIYVFAQLFSNTAYTFLPILIAFSAAKVFGGNQFLGAVIGMIMIHPNLQNAWTVASEGVQTYQSVFGGLYKIPLVGYQGHVIPVIIAVWLMCQIEKRLHKVVPAMIDLFVTPLVSVFVTGYLTLAVIGPIFTTLEDGIINGVQALIQLPYGIGSFVMGGLYAITVVAGIHHMYTLIDLGQLAKFGFTYWLPLASAANVAQGGAAFAVALKSKNAKKYRHGMEYGSARWGTHEDIAPYIDPVFQNNVILTKTESLTMNSRPKGPKTARNKNVLVIGGPGSGKTRFWLKPNLMQMHSSYVVTDPKGTILVECGKMLQRGAPKLGKDGKPMKDKHGKVIYEPYRIKVLNTINFKKSMHYNPFAYIHSEKDILKLVTTLIANTKGEGKAGDDFWVKAETLLYCALIGYIHYEAPVEEQNFSTLIEFINAMEVREDDEEFKNRATLIAV